jgi:hypothetical protein
MPRFAFVVFAVSLSLASAQSVGSAFVGRWGFNISTADGPRAAWLGVTEKDGSLAVAFQPTGGNVAPVKNFKVSGTHLTLQLSPTMVWELDASGGKLTGRQTVGEKMTALTGLRAPEIRRDPPKAWTDPTPLFDGKDLEGWQPIGDTANSHWIVKDGLLVNQAHGANLRTVRTFDDFKLHFEANCPDEANSGFYLRGRYEVQLEYEPLTKNPPERRIGSIYGRIAPRGDLPRTPGKWETFDVTLVGRTVTVVRNGVTTIDRQEIEGITGGALDANEGNPGPFYIQGDHTGGLQFRNITVSVPKP